MRVRGKRVAAAAARWDAAARWEANQDANRAGAAAAARTAGAGSSTTRAMRPVSPCSSGHAAEDTCDETSLPLHCKKCMAAVFDSAGGGQCAASHPSFLYSTPEIPSAGGVAAAAAAEHRLGGSEADTARPPAWLMKLTEVARTKSLEEFEAAMAERGAEKEARRRAEARAVIARARVTQKEAELAELAALAQVGVGDSGTALARCDAAFFP